MIFHYRVSDNLLARLNPNTKLVALLSYSIVISSCGPLETILLSLVPISIALGIRLPFREYIKESLFFILLSVLMAITSFLSQGDILHAFSYALSFLSMVLSSMLLTDTTMSDDLARSIGGALSKLIGRYAYIFSTLVEITLSMIPIIIDSTAGIFDARRARGASFFSHPLKTVSELSIAILSSLLDKAEIYIDALYSRGYDASQIRDRAGYRAVDFIIMAVSVIFLSLKMIFEHMR